MLHFLSEKIMQFTKNYYKSAWLHSKVKPNKFIKFVGEENKYDITC